MSNIFKVYEIAKAEYERAMAKGVDADTIDELYDEMIEAQRQIYFGIEADRF